MLHPGLITPTHVERCMPYCFKDVYNGLQGNKNQVYTRALHAEENAFLQISKYGGTKVNGGNLFTTASPCELCAKKAYQLGIKHIYYIDPYPGISQNHILTFGTKKNPEMKLFYGAIGQAYLDFYEPRIALKDEMEMLTGVNIKKVVKEEKEDDSLEYADITYERMVIELKFLGDRNKIESMREVSACIHKEGVSQLNKKIIWTGSAYDGSELVSGESDDDLSLNEVSSELPYKYNIIIGKERGKGESIHYKVLTKLKDEKQVMEPYLAHMVKNKTNKLILRVITPESMIKDVTMAVYADLEMKTMTLKEALKGEKSDEQEIYEFVINDANANYTYAIEWKFKKD